VAKNTAPHPPEGESPINIKKNSPLGLGAWRVSMKSLLLSIIILFTAEIAHANFLDSLRIENKNGKNYIVHRVDSGEYLGKILSKYKSNKTDFYAANPKINTKSVLLVGQLLYIPTKSNAVVAATKPIQKEETESEVRNLDDNGIEVVDIPEATPKDEPISPKTEKAKIDSPKVVIAPKPTAKPVPAGSKVHIVGSKETLYLIAKKYNVYVWQIRQWNEMKNDSLKLNQKLVIQKTNTVVAKVPVKKDTSKIAQGPAGESSKPKTTTSPTKPAQIPNAGGGKKINESGIAEAISSDNTTKLLALHPTAPVGTLVQVKNSTNGASVWVKVVGKLPAGDAIIRLSPKSFEKLQARDKRIRVDISYVLSL
jgi:LysM repeat protein